MKRFSDLSLKRKLLIVCAGLILVFVFATGTHVYHLQRAAVIEAADQRLYRQGLDAVSLLGSSLFDSLPDPPSGAVASSWYERASQLNEYASANGLLGIYAIFIEDSVPRIAVQGQAEIQGPPMGWGKKTVALTPALVRAAESRRAVFVEGEGLSGSVVRAAYVPMRNSHGTPFVILVEESLDPIIARINQELLGIVLIGFSAFFVSGFIVYLLAERLTRSLDQLTDFCTRLVVNDFQADQADVDQLRETAASNGDETGEVARSVLSMHQALGNYLERIRHESSRRESIEGELQTAQEIQKSILPTDFVRNDPDSGYGIMALFEPAGELGGDFFDYTFQDGRLFFTVGDVSGKGAPAALIMGVTEALLHTHARRGLMPSEILAEVNRDLCDHQNRGIFVTIFAGLLDLESGMLAFSNAGHLSPVLSRAKSESQYLWSSANPPLGLKKASTFHQETLGMSPGDNLLLYTDGVTEARGPNREFFGEQRLRDSVQRHHEKGPEALLSSLRQDLRDFAAGEKQNDDITMLLMSFHGVGNVGVGAGWQTLDESSSEQSQTERLSEH